MSRELPVVELFGPTLQGEGALAGQMSLFLRTGLCGHRCVWCDSMHAVDPKQVKEHAEWLTAEKIVSRLDKLAPHRENDPERNIWVSLTGGDPLIYDLSEVMHGLRLRRFRVAVETQGAIWQDWLKQCDLVTVSPKGPSSGMLGKFDPAVLEKYTRWLGRHLVIKVVCFSDEDLDWAQGLHEQYPHVRFFLSSGTPMGVDEADWQLEKLVLLGFKGLVTEVLKRPELQDVTVLPQLHTLLWGRDLGR